MISNVLSIVSKNKSQINNFSFLVAVSLLITGVGFLTQLQLARFFGKETFGLIAYGTAIASYGAVIVRYGFDKSLVRDLVHYESDFTLILFSSLLLRFFCFGLFLFGMVVWLLSGVDPDVGWAVVMIAIANTVIGLDLQAVFDSWRLMSLHAVFRICFRSIYFVAIWSMILWFPDQFSIIDVGCSSVVASCVFLLLQYRWVFKRLVIDIKFSRVFSLVRKMLRVNFIVWLGGLGTVSFGAFGQLVLKHYHGAAELGGYAVAWMFATLVNIFFMQVARVAYPEMAKVTMSSVSIIDNINFIFKYMAVMVLVAFPFFICAVLFPQYMISFIFPEEYESAIPVLPYIGIYILLSALNIVVSDYLIFIRMERAYFFCVIIGGSVSIVSSYILIPLLGSIGAAISLISSYFSSLIFSCIFIAYKFLKFKNNIV